MLLDDELNLAKSNKAAVASCPEGQSRWAIRPKTLIMRKPFVSGVLGIWSGIR